MAWKEVKTDADIEELMQTCLGFHDSCVVSATYVSGDRVDEKGAMWFGDALEGHSLNILFDSQWEPHRFELCFQGVRRMRLIGAQDNYLNNIYEAYLQFHEEILPCRYRASKRVIVWSDHAEFTLKDAEDGLAEPGISYVIAASLRWRIMEKE